MMKLIPVSLIGVFAHAERGEAWLVLADASGRFGLPILVSSDPKLLLMELVQRKQPVGPGDRRPGRPLTYTFLAGILQAVGAELVQVEVMDLVSGIFYAVAVIRANGVEHRIDARPSDAVALAVCMGRPIFATEALMSAAGKPLGPGGEPPGMLPGFRSWGALRTDDPGAPAT